MANEEVIKKLLIEIGYKQDTASRNAAMDAVNALTSAVGKFAAAAATAFSINRILDFNKQLNQFAINAARIGTTADSLDAFAKAGGTAGASIEEMRGAAERFSQFVKTNPGAAEWLRGWSKSFGYVRDAQTGLLKDFQGREVKVNDALKNWARGFAEFAEKQKLDRAVFLNVLEHIGLTERQFNALIDRRAEAVEGRLNKIFETYNKNARQAEINARNVAEQLTIFDKTLGSIFQKITTGPQLSKGLEELNNWLDNHGPEINKKLDNIAGWFEKNTPIIAANVDMAARAFGGWETVLGGIAALLAGSLIAALGPAGWLIMGVGALAGSIAAIDKIIKSWDNTGVKEALKNEGASGEPDTDKLRRYMQGFGGGSEAKKHTEAVEKNTSKLEELVTAIRQFFAPYMSQTYLGQLMGKFIGEGGAGGGGAGGGGWGNEGGLGGGVGGGRASNAQRAVAMKAAMEQLKKEGVPDDKLVNAAAMLVGQADMESGLNPRASHDKGTGYGIYGARNERWSGMTNWIKSQGGDPNSVEWQIKQMAHDAMTANRGRSRNILMSGDISEGAVNAFTKDFESPAIVNRRIGAVMQALRSHTGSGVSGFAPEVTSSIEGLKKAGINVISGYRSPEHNAAVGGAPRSRHMGLHGGAFDVAPRDVGRAKQWLREHGMGGRIGTPFNFDPNHFQILGANTRPLGDQIANYHNTNSKVANTNFGPFTTNVNVGGGSGPPSVSAIGFAAEQGMRRALMASREQFAPMVG